MIRFSIGDSVFTYRRGRVRVERLAADIHRDLVKILIRSILVTMPPAVTFSVESYVYQELKSHPAVVVEKYEPEEEPQEGIIY